MHISNIHISMHNLLLYGFHELNSALFTDFQDLVPFHKIFIYLFSFYKNVLHFLLDVLKDVTYYRPCCKNKILLASKSVQYIQLL